MVRRAEYIKLEARRAAVLGNLADEQTATVPSGQENCGPIQNSFRDREKFEYIHRLHSIIIAEVFAHSITVCHAQSSDFPYAALSSARAPPIFKSTHFVLLPVVQA
jgi:hypothetical protein